MDSKNNTSSHAISVTTDETVGTFVESRNTPLSIRLQSVRTFSNFNILIFEKKARPHTRGKPMEVRPAYTSSYTVHFDLGRVDVTLTQR